MGFCNDIYKGITILIKTTTRNSEGSKIAEYTKGVKISGLIMPSTGKLTQEIFGVTDIGNGMIFTPNTKNDLLIDNGHVLIDTKAYIVKRVMPYGPKQMILLAPYVGKINIV